MSKQTKEVSIHLPLKLTVIATLWPSFVSAGVFAGLFFAFIDPLTLSQSFGVESNPRLTGYSIVFLFFWALGAISISAALAMLRAPHRDEGGR